MTKEVVLKAQAITIVLPIGILLPMLCVGLRSYMEAILLEKIAYTFLVIVKGQ